MIALSSGGKADAVRAAGADVVVGRNQGGIGEQLHELVPTGLDAVAGAVAGPVIEFDLWRLYLRSILLLGSTMHTPDQFEVLVAAANAGQVAPVVARTFPLEPVRVAHEEFERRGHVGRLVLLP